jgi:adenine-specific DNA methylase
MKYMGSKRMMLLNGLGTVLSNQARTTKRFVDLFSGSSAVAIHVAKKYNISVLAFDLQHYSKILAAAVICRRQKIEWESSWNEWHSNAEALFKKRKVPALKKLTQETVASLREWSDDQNGLPTTKAYGGHYFSPHQAVWIDVLRKSLPPKEPMRTSALAALIHAVSQCAAAPGHTAQPFQPTRSAKPFLWEAWERDVVQRTKDAFSQISEQFARKRGSSHVAEATLAATCLKEGDLAFIDPPYSDVQYSRFYHVLETIAEGSCGTVSGVGRYPAPKLRPRSKFSLKTESQDALDKLLKTVAERGAKAVLTFPDHECSNGLSGEIVRDLASTYFHLREQTIKSKFSTMGGKGDHGKNEAGRKARHSANELILVLKPK